MATNIARILDITTSTWLEYDHQQYTSLQEYLNYLSGLLEPYKLNCPPERINAILLTPHAGVRFSGLVGLSTYLPLADTKRIPGTIIIFSTWHAGPPSTSRAILPAFDKIKTPLGMLDVDTELRSLLLARVPHTFSIDTHDNNYMNAEHSHIVQYPLIQHVFAKSSTMPRVLPILIPAHSNTTQFTEDIYDLLNKPTYFIACNTDISHVNGDFPTRAKSYPALVQHDNIVMRYLFGSSQGNNSSACGIGALKWMKAWLRFKKIAKYPRLTMYYHSHSVSPGNPVTVGMGLQSHASGTGVQRNSRSPGVGLEFNVNGTDISQILIQDRKLFNPAESTVGYMGVLITSQPYIDLKSHRSMAYYLTDFERLYLRDMARFSVMTQLYYDMSLDELVGYLLWHPAWSIIKRGIFVTIYQTTTSSKKNLRGCIGTVDANTDTVINNVIKYARESAFQDNRFSPLTKEEFQQTDKTSRFIYEISVLAPKAPITIPVYLEDPDKFSLGQDGILLVQGPNQGFFLPSVATEFGMTKASQLSELCRKAGIQDTQCYKKPGTKLYYMEGFGFGF